MKYYLFFLLVILSSDVFAASHSDEDSYEYSYDRFGYQPRNGSSREIHMVKHLPLLHIYGHYTESAQWLSRHGNNGIRGRDGKFEYYVKNPETRTSEELCEASFPPSFMANKPTNKFASVTAHELGETEFLRVGQTNGFKRGELLYCKHLIDLTHCLSDSPPQQLMSYCRSLSGFIDKWMRPPKEKDDDCNARGAPAWHIDRKTMALKVRDIPLWYQPALGDEIKINLNYKINFANYINQPFGNRWSFDMTSYLIVEMSKKEELTQLTMISKNGYRSFFESTDNETFTNRQQKESRLIKVGEDKFQYHSQNGEVTTYSHKAEQENFNVILMTQKTDIHGNTVTFDYDKKLNLIGITDALGKRTKLFYNQENLVTRVEDPFERSATFTYNEKRNLTSITDMQGYTSTIGYDEKQKIVYIEDAKGRTKFLIEHYVVKGNSPWYDRTTITNPNGDIEKYYYGSLISTYYVAPNDVIDNKDNIAPTTMTNNLGANQFETLYPNGASIHNKYDTKDRLIEKTNHLGETHKYTYNSKGKYLTVTNPLGQVTSYSYYPNDLDIKTITTANGTISYEYNDRRQVTKLDGNGQVIRYTYLENGKIDSVTNALNQVTKYHYNDNHRLQSIKVEGKTIATYEYDNIGRKIAETDLHGRKTTYAYNNIDTLVKITYPGGRTISREYNTCPRMLEAETLPGDRRYKYEYDAAKQLTSKTDPLGGKVSYERDKNGNITTLIDKNQNRTSYKYNLVNQKTKLTYADGTALKTTYDKGRITAITNGRGMQTTYGYNDKQQLSTISYTDNKGVSFVYHNGQLIEVTDDIGTHKYSYDSQGRLKGYDSPWSDDVITYSYDLLGRTTGLTLNGKPYAKYEYDKLGRLTQVNNFTWDYDDTTPSVMLTYPNGIKHTTTLDAIGDIANRKYANEDITALNIDYDYNNAGELISEKSSRYYPFTTWLKLGKAKISQYNPLNQLVTQDDTPLVYDADGNLIEGYLADKTPFTASYDINNQLTSIHFKRDGIDYEERFRYFYTGMLASYELKENGKRTHYRQFLRLGTLEIQERNAQDQVVAQNLWNPTAPGGIGGLLERTVGAKQYYHYDHNGNPVQTVNAKGEVTDNLFYTPFGELISGTINHVQPFGHSTKRGDFKSGLLYFGYRFYVPHMERWLNRDPIGTNGGLNIYAYVEGNPIMYVDHFGLFKVCRRPLSYFDSYMSSGATGTNLGIFHEHGFYEDGTGDNTGFTKNGLFDDRQNFSDYKCNSKSYDDNTMRQAEKKIANKWKNGYNPLTKNCQDYTDALIDEYNRIKNPPICRLTRRGWRCN